MQLGFAAHPWLKRKWEKASAPHEPLGVLMSKNMPMSLGSTAGGTGACPCTAWLTIQWQSFPLTSRCLFLAMFAKEAYSFSHCGSWIHDNHWLCWLWELDGSGLQSQPILQDEDCNPDSYFGFKVSHVTLGLERRRFGCVKKTDVPKFGDWLSGWLLKLAFWGSRFCELNPDINTTDLLVIYVGPSIPHICWCYIR